MDKIKKNKGKVHTRKKKVKQPSHGKKALKPPTINIVNTHQPQKSDKEALVVENVNGKKTKKKESPKQQEPRFSIKISAPKMQEDQLSMSEKSSQSNRISENSKEMFNKKEDKQGDSDMDMSDKSDSNKAIGVNLKNQPVKKSHFGNPSKSQRNNLKLDIKESKNGRSQRGMKTSGNSILLCLTYKDVMTAPQKNKVSSISKNKKVATFKQNKKRNSSGYNKPSFSFGKEVIKKNPKAKLVQETYGLEPETDESDTEEMMEEIVGDTFVHPFKSIHFKFLNIEIKKEKDPEPQEKSQKNMLSKPGYGDLLGINRGKNGGKSSRSIRSGRSLMTGKSFRETLKNKDNGFRKMTLGKIKQNYKFQILMGSKIVEIKNYFGCISASLLPYYYNRKGKKIDDPHFIRRAAKNYNYEDEMLIDMPTKLRNTETFKLIENYNNKQYLAYNDRLREAQEKMKDFEVDVHMFSEFFGEKLPIEDFATS